MRCEEVKDILSLYIDNELNEEERNEIEKHLKACEECNREYEDLLTIKKLLNEMPQVQLPDNFKQELHEKLVKCISEEDNEIEENNEAIDLRKNSNKALVRKKKFNWKIMSGVAAVIFLMVVSAASLLDNNLRMGDMSKMEMKKAAPEENITYEMTQDEGQVSEDLIEPVPLDDDKAKMNINGFDAPKAEGAPRVTQSRNTALKDEGLDNRMIFSGYLHLGVEDYDSAYKSINEIVDSRGGYVQNSNITNKATGENNKSLKVGNITVRIPQNEFKNTISEITKKGTVIDQRENTNDVSILYKNASNELVNLRNQENTIMESLAKEKNDSNKAETQKELARVRGEIDDLKSSINQWNDLVELSIIDIILEEVDKNIEGENQG